MKSTFTVIALYLALASSYAQVSSSNGFSLPVGTNTTPQTIKVMLVFAEVSGTDQLESSLWASGQLPTDANNYFDASLPSNGPQAYLTKYFYEASFGKYIVLGDYLDHTVTVPQSTMTGDGTIDVLNHLSSLINSSQITFGKSSIIADFDQWTILDSNDPYNSNFYMGLPKSNISGNDKIDVLIIGWRNNPFFPDLAGEGMAPRNQTTTIGTFTGCDNKAAFGFAGSGAGTYGFIIAEYFHGMFGGNNWHIASGAGNHTFLAIPTAAQGIPSQSQAGAQSNIVTAWDRNHLGWLGWSDNNLTIQKTNLISANDLSGNETVTDLTIPSNAITQEFILRDFVAYGDSIRIKLPYINWNQSGDVKNQYLWIENHQKLNNYTLDIFPN